MRKNNTVKVARCTLLAGIYMILVVVMVIQRGLMPLYAHNELVVY